MERADFCTCKDLNCPYHSSKHNGECTPCILKNLKQHEIPACFWDKIGDDSNAKSEYTFLKFAKKVVGSEAGCKDVE